MHKRQTALMLGLVLAVLVSGCLSGQAIKRQAAEPAEYEDNPPEANASFPAEPEDSITTPQCNESWVCTAWSLCAGGRQNMTCRDSSGCSGDLVIRTQDCAADSCSSDADCPPAEGCRAYFCHGTPRSCKQYVTIPCCGDGTCDQSEQGACPSDCSQQQSVTISITNITYKMPEHVEIRNSGDTGQSMTGWSLADTASHVFIFPQFTLEAGSSVRVHTEAGTGGPSDIYWGRNCSQSSHFGCVWNDGGDTATLKNGKNETISTYSY